VAQKDRKIASRVYGNADDIGFVLMEEPKGIAIAAVKVAGAKESGTIGGKAVELGILLRAK
jgi:hypothetical protein